MVIKTSITAMEIRILRFFVEHVGEQFAIREVARRTRIDYKLTHGAIQKLVAKAALVKKRQANVDLCSLDLHGNLTNLYYVEMLRAKELLDKHPELQTFFKSILDKTKTIYYSLVVFGSFARGTATKTSDLDVLIITPSRNMAEEIERIINSEALFLKRRVQPIVLDEKEFVENLASKKLNVVGEAFKNHVIIRGVEAFYSGVKQTV